MPEGWTWERIGSLCSSLQYGTSEKSLSTGRIPVIRMGNIDRFGEINYENLVYTSNEDDIIKYTLIKGDLLFNRTNSSELVGKTAIYRGEYTAIYAGYIIRFSPMLINNEYVNYVMNSKYEKDYCYKVKTDGVNQSNINSQKLANFLIPIPPLKEQIRIDSLLKEAFALITNIEEDKNILQSLISKTKSQILNLAIQGKLVPQVPTDEPASKLLKQIQAEKEVLIKAGKIKREKPKKTSDNSHYVKPFEIPKSWVWCRLEDICEFDPRNNLDGEMAVSFVPMTLISDGFSNSHISEVRKWEEIKKGFTHFREGDVGIAKITPCFENRKSIVFKNLKNKYGAGTTELYILRPMSEPFLSNYILWFIKTDNFIANGIDSFTGAVGQQRVGKNYIKETLFPLPPLSEQKRIVERIKAIFQTLDAIL
ncbi:restriction endonuclease subunit S [Bacteroides sp. 51]|uniref:restriction endonuclease subunit S n=1 Tax=Bacteroides sp. 51 TaxID=2302938 RepID=UPI0013D34459|nr:type I restriction endonuclease [Bacteroides sp. 51]